MLTEAKGLNYRGIPEVGQMNLEATCHVYVTIARMHRVRTSCIRDNYLHNGPRASCIRDNRPLRVKWLWVGARVLPNTKLTLFDVVWIVPSYEHQQHRLHSE